MDNKPNHLKINLLKKEKILILNKKQLKKLTNQGKNKKEKIREPKVLMIFKLIT